ncbi:MAG: glycosyltransferase family 2 protein [Caldilineales bacterium]
MKLIAVILTKNEARHIGDCIASVAWADAVLVSDSFSEDDTAALAEAAGAVVEQRVFEGWAVQRNASLDSAAEMSADWVLFVDAAERCTPELAQEIRHVIVTRPEAGWSIPRFNFIVGKQVRHGGFYPDYQLRLLRVGKARYDLSRPVHEVVELDGTQGRLQHHLLHYNYDTWAQFHAKQRRYGAMEADILAQRGIRARPHNFVLQPLREFRRRYVTLQGYRDGWHGLKLCALLAYYYGFYPYQVLRAGTRVAQPAG